MNAYRDELRRCRVALLLRAVFAAGGNMGIAAKETGVHRNTITRILHRAGYNSARVKHLMKTRGKVSLVKPGEAPAAQEWRVEMKTATDKENTVAGANIPTPVSEDGLFGTYRFKAQNSAILQ